MTTSRKQASIERRNQIIDAALEVFSTQGYGQATNKEIAKAAGISSAGLIYHYFDDQEALFKAVLSERMPAVRFSIEESSQILTMPPEVVLRLVASKILETLSDPTMIALLRLIIGEASRQSHVFHLVWEGASQHLLGFLYTYFEQLMADGKMRKVDPGSAVRSFLGPFFAYIMTTLVAQVPDPKTPDPETLAETTVSIFWRGVAVETTSVDTTDEEDSP
ncbi:MAG: TetR/AcrR family transcriptional regulator [Chloroflexota bacterium]